MPTLSALLAALTAVSGLAALPPAALPASAPAATAAGDAAAQGQGPGPGQGPEQGRGGESARPAGSVWQQLAQGFLPQSAAQVRIEQRVIWRIVPMPGPARDTILSLAPTGPRPPAPVLVERRMDKCIPMSAIVGGQPRAGSRLILFLRDRRLVAADLERACSARDFYSGFYVDKPDPDGRLCVNRDLILSRSGARCEISAFHLLVASG